MVWCLNLIASLSTCLTIHWHVHANIRADNVTIYSSKQEYLEKVQMTFGLLDQFCRVSHHFDISALTEFALLPNVSVLRQ